MGKWDKYKETEENRWDKYKVEKAPERPQYNALGKIFEVPGAAVRSALMGKGFTPGAINPQDVPKFQDIATNKMNEFIANKASRIPNPMARNLAVGVGTGLANTASMAGMAADYATNPGEILTSLAATKAGQLLSKTTAGKALGRFLSRPRRIFNWGGKEGLQKVAEKAHKGGQQVFQGMKDKYDTVFNEIKDGKASVAGIKLKVDEAVNSFPEGGGLGSYKKITKRLAKTPNETMSAKELHNLKQEVGKTIRWKGQSDAINHAKKEVYYSINEALEKAGGAKYTGLSKEYREFAYMMDDVNSAIMERGRPGMKKLAGSVMNPGGTLTARQESALKALDKQLPGSDKFLHDFLAWRRAELVKRYGSLVGGGGLLYGLRRRVGETMPDFGEDGAP